mmetsp:Transcript_6649/g.10755  ORF Transcript_6649/g.10755 Transcript_6649/m.10755 type:complete len:486 (-) Transcript_6649:221-1678(-)
MTAEQKVVHCLTQQREQLSDEVKRIRASLISITKDAGGAHACLTAVEEEQRRQREAAVAAIVRGVQDLVNSEMGGLERALASGASPIQSKLDQISALATEADAALTTTEHGAVDAGMQAAAAVSAWAVETESVCNSIQSAQGKAEHASKEIQAATGATATSISSLCDQVRTWGAACTSTHDVVDGAADAAKNVGSMQESLLHKWDTAREVALRSSQDWANGLSSADSALEGVITRHADASQEVAAVCKHVSGHNAAAREAMLELVSHEERRTVALEKLSCAQTRHDEEEHTAENARSKHLDALVDSAGAVTSTASCHGKQLSESWQHLIQAAETIDTAACKAEKAAQEHQRAIGSVSQLVFEVEEAHVRSEHAREKYATHVAGLGELPTMYRNAVAEAPMSAFDEEADVGDEHKALQVAISSEKRPTQDELISEYHTGKPCADFKNVTDENQQGTTPSKEPGIGKIRSAEKPSARAALKEVQRVR